MKFREEYLNTHVKYLHREYAAVKVKMVEMGKLMVLPGTICCVDKSTPIIKLPENFRITDESGEELEPVGTFYVTVQTIDPYHLVLDVIDIL